MIIFGFANIKYKMLFGFFFIYFTSICWIFYCKTILKPMRESIQMLDRFIKDTTHELNTQLLQFYQIYR